MTSIAQKKEETTEGKTMVVVVIIIIVIKTSSGNMSVSDTTISATINNIGNAQRYDNNTENNNKATLLQDE